MVTTAPDETRRQTDGSVCAPAQSTSDRPHEDRIDSRKWFMHGLHYHFNNLRFKHRLRRNDFHIPISSGLLCLHRMFEMLYIYIYITYIYIYIYMCRLLKSSLSPLYERLRSPTHPARRHIYIYTYTYIHIYIYIYIYIEREREREREISIIGAPKKGSRREGSRCSTLLSDGSLDGLALFRARPDDLLLLMMA